MAFNLNTFLTTRNTFLSKPYKYGRTIRFYRRWSPESLPKTKKVAQASFHKARTGCLQIDRSLRLESKKWLEKHNLSSMDDGDLQEGVTRDE